MKPRRPEWCGHLSCKPLIGWDNKMCGGCLPEPVPHDGDFNTHRLCIEADGVIDLMVNRSDCYLLGLVVERLRKDSVAQSVEESSEETP
jgi:hypothetical protein